MTFLLDALLAGDRVLRDDGADVPLRKAINFIGCTLTDDAVNDATNVDPAGSVTFASVKAALAAADSSISVNGQSVTSFGAALTFKSTVGPVVSQAQLAGTGAAAGQRTQLKGQQGQQQSGGAANNDGGDLELYSGVPGTGGGGAAGQAGTLSLFCGATRVARAYKEPAVAAAALGLDVPYVVFAENAGAVNVIQLRATTANSGTNMSVEAQSAKIGSGGNGGNLTMRAGGKDGAGTHGYVSLETATAVRVKGNGTGLGLFNTPPVAQPTRAGQLTDNSGGTSGGNTIAAINGAVDPTAALKTDTANAIATIAARLNLLEGKISAAGTGIGVTA